jgi:hypothetical protein
MPLKVETIHQAQGSELVFAQFTREEAAGLFPELSGALIDKGLVVVVVLVHLPSLPAI